MTDSPSTDASAAPKPPSTFAAVLLFATAQVAALFAPFAFAGFAVALHESEPYFFSHLRIVSLGALSAGLVAGGAATGLALTGRGGGRPSIRVGAVGGVACAALAVVHLSIYAPHPDLVLAIFPASWLVFAGLFAKSVYSRRERVQYGTTFVIATGAIAGCVALVGENVVETRQQHEVRV